MESGSSGGYLFIHHFVNELAGAFVGRLCSVQEIMEGFIGHPHYSHFTLTEPAAPVGAEGNFIVGNEIVQSFRFFLGHSCHNHVPLKAKQFDEAVAELHCVKNADSVIIHRIIQKFKRVSGAVKPDNGVFLRKPFNRSIAYLGLKGVQNILPVDVMPKRRFVELNDYVHGANIA